jgi:hypothetical protein
MNPGRSRSLPGATDGRDPLGDSDVDAAVEETNRATKTVRSCLTRFPLPLPAWTHSKLTLSFVTSVCLLVAACHPKLEAFVMHNTVDLDLMFSIPPRFGTTSISLN